MKMRTYNFLTLVFVLLFVGCGLDNYDDPKSLLQGKIVFQNRQIGLRGTGGAVQLQLYQEGYDLNDHINVYVNQKGEFQALLFDGTYKLITRDKNGPWVNSRDTTFVDVKGNTPVIIEVVPFFMFKEFDVTVNQGSVNVSAEIEQIVDDAEIEFVSVLLSETSFVDDVSNIYRKDLTSLDSLNFDYMDDISSILEDTSHSLFARVGIRAVGSDQSIYSDIVQIK